MSVDVKLTDNITPFARAIEPQMCKPHRVEWTIDLAPPEFDEFKQTRILWRNVVELPDKGLSKYRPEVGQAIEELCRGLSVPVKHELSFTHFGLMMGKIKRTHGNLLLFCLFSN